MSNFTNSLEEGKRSKKLRQSNSLSKTVKSTASQLSPAIVREESFRSLLHETLTQLMKITICLNSFQTAHDVQTIHDHAHQRASASLQQEISLMLERMNNFEQHSNDNILTAYSQVSLNLLNDLERATFESNLARMQTSLADDNRYLKLETSRLQTSFADTLAKNEQLINSLQVEKQILEFKNKSLLATVEMLNKELEKSRRVTSELNQSSIELSMQSIHYKGEVDRIAMKISHSIHSRLGFVPDSVLKYLKSISRLKAPTKIKSDNQPTSQTSTPTKQTFGTVLDVSRHSNISNTVHELTN